MFVFLVGDFVREVMIEYSKEVMKVGKMLFELLSEALGLNTNHLKDMDCTNSLLLLGHYYPPCPTRPDCRLKFRFYGL